MAAGDDRYDFDPYGELEAKDSSSTHPEQELSADARENPLRFEGFYYNNTTRTYDMQARVYRPDIERFLSQDRFEGAGADLSLQADPLTNNSYAFAGGNPVGNIEYDGHRIADNAKATDPELDAKVRAGGGSVSGEVPGGAAPYSGPLASPGWSPLGARAPAVLRRTTPPAPRLIHRRISGTAIVPTKSCAIRCALNDLTSGLANSLHGTASAVVHPKRTIEDFLSDPLGGVKHAMGNVRACVNLDLERCGRLEGDLLLLGSVAAVGKAATNARETRKRYVEDARSIVRESDQPLAAGEPLESVARRAVDSRNLVKLAARESPVARRFAEWLNTRRYGNPVGPTYEDLLRGGKTPEQVILGAGRPNRRINRLLLVK